MFAPQTRSNRKIDNEDLRRAVFSLIHEPPANREYQSNVLDYGAPAPILKENGTHVGTALVAKTITAAGYKWRKAERSF